MIPEHRQDGNFEAAYLLRQDCRLFGQAVVDKITAQQKHVGAVSDLLEQRSHDFMRCIVAMKVR